MNIQLEIDKLVAAGVSLEDATNAVLNAAAQVLNERSGTPAPKGRDQFGRIGGADPAGFFRSLAPAPSGPSQEQIDFDAFKKTLHTKSAPGQSPLLNTRNAIEQLKAFRKDLGLDE
ncbi:hypothetical protein [Erwinia billingiae]|uniref:hypothetical protein n=1 Tax=Erwinia billingiae TaxID=182337 RepID=UPI00320B4E66